MSKLGKEGMSALGGEAAKEGAGMETAAGEEVEAA